MGIFESIYRFLQHPTCLPGGFCTDAQASPSRLRVRAAKKYRRYLKCRKRKHLFEAELDYDDAVVAQRAVEEDEKKGSRELAVLLSEYATVLWTNFEAVGRENDKLLPQIIKFWEETATIWRRLRDEARTSKKGEAEVEDEYVVVLVALGDAYVADYEKGGDRGQLHKGISMFEEVRGVRIRATSITSSRPTASMTTKATSLRSSIMKTKSPTATTTTCAMKATIGLAKSIRLCCEHDGNTSRLQQIIGYLEEWDVPADGSGESEGDRWSRREELDKVRALLVELTPAASTGAHEATQSR